jgi:hypothetical protein
MPREEGQSAGERFQPKWDVKVTANLPTPWTMCINITYRLNRVHRYNLNFPAWDLTVEFDGMPELIDWLDKVLDAQRGTETPTDETGHP